MGGNGISQGSFAWLVSEATVRDVPAAEEAGPEAPPAGRGGSARGAAQAPTRSADGF